MQNKYKSLRDTLHNYFETGVINKSEIPPFDNYHRDEKWLFYQLLSLINELRVNDINTSEYTNTSNMGLKPNGYLGMFDIGFGNYFENFEKQPEELNINENTLLDKIKNSLGIKSNSAYIGSGFFGHAHDIGDNKILKITKDKSEAINSYKIIGKNMIHIANIYDVRKVKINKIQYYTIILEKLKLNKSLDQLFKNLEEYFNEARNQHLEYHETITNVKQKNKLAGEFLEDFTKLGYNKTWEKWNNKTQELKNINFDPNDIYDLSEWIQHSMTNNNDIDTSPPDFIIDIYNNLIK